MTVERVGEEQKEVFKADVSKATKPLLFVKVGHLDMLHGYSWIPTESDLKRVYEYFQNAVGDRYTVMVYHLGAELEVEKGDKETRLLEVSPLDDFWKEMGEESWMKE